VGERKSERAAEQNQNRIDESETKFKRHNKAYIRLPISTTEIDLS
jgi:hypothetical protein